jgi:hypothetical protein
MMTNSFLTPIIVFLIILLINAIETSLRIIGISDQVKNFVMNYFFIFLLIVDLTFIFQIIRDLKYSRME